MKKTIFTLLLAILLPNLMAQNWNGYSSINKRQMEYLNRGLVAVKTNSGVFLSWRFLGNDDKNVRFNIYRDNVKLNTEPLSGATNYTDASGTVASTYSIGVVDPISLAESSKTSAVKVWENIYKTLQLRRPTATVDTVTYTPNDCSVGDLDGDGEYEIVVKWDPSNSLDNYFDGYTDKVYLDAYKLDGTFMWRIDLGVNIRAGAHYTQFLVYDFDGDGKAEVTCMTAPGTIDGKGNYVLMGSDVGTVDLRNSRGRIVTGSEYLTVFDGLTGANKSTVEFQPARGKLNDWIQTGNDIGGFSYRFLAVVAYLDGVRPSIVMCRGYYFKSALAAYDLKSTGLQQRWLYQVDNTNAWTEAYGQGNHSLAVADVDGDSFDEIIYGGAVINDDGTCSVNSHLGHGDALHVTDIDPDRPGYEVFKVQEGANKNSQALYDPKDGSLIWKSAITSGDNGRGMAADIDPNHRGLECWSQRLAGVYDCKGVKISSIKPTTNGGAENYNFRIYWDGDLQDELLDKEAIFKWDPATSGTNTIFNMNDYTPVSFNNGTKSNPCLSADIFGDWREEVIAANSADPSQIVIFTTTTPTNYRLYTLMHDPVYRLSVAWQDVAYNQPPHLGFYIGDGLDSIPYPNMFTQKDSIPQKVNLYGLKNAIKDAQSIYGSSVKGTTTLQFPEIAFTELNTSIVLAQNYLNSVNPNLTENEGQSAVDSAVNVMKKAIIAFKSKQILVYSNPDANTFYSIYSYGDANSTTTSATTALTKKFLTDSGNRLTYQTGTADANEVNLSDPLRTDYKAHWKITASLNKPGYMTIRNRASGKYLQISGTLSDTPIELYFLYKKTENGKLGFAINVSDSISNCLGVGTSPSVDMTTYDDLVRLRWIIETSKEPVIVNDSSNVADIGYDWTGSALVLPVTGSTFGTSTTATTFIINSGKNTEVNLKLTNASGRSVVGYDNKSTYKNPTSASIAFIPIKNDTIDFLEVSVKDIKEIQAIKINGTSSILTGTSKGAILYSGTTPFNENLIIGSDSLVLAACRAGNTGVIFESTIPVGTKSFRIYKGIPISKSGDHYVIDKVSGKNVGGGEQPRIAYISLTIKDYLANGIENTYNSGKEIESKEYYDFLGHRVSEKSKGLLVIRTKYNDGTVSCTKVFIQQ